MLTDGMAVGAVCGGVLNPGTRASIHDSNDTKPGRNCVTITVVPST